MADMMVLVGRYGFTGSSAGPRLVAAGLTVFLLTILLADLPIRQEGTGIPASPTGPAVDSQVAEFDRWFRAGLLEGSSSLSEDDLDYEIQLHPDLDGDGLLEFFVSNQTRGYCGSGGCSYVIYRSLALGQYERMLLLQAVSSPRVRAGARGLKEFLLVDSYVGDEPLHAVYALRNGTYKHIAWEFCGGVPLEDCDPLRITRFPEETGQRVKPGTVALAWPALNAQPATLGSGQSASSVGRHGVLGFAMNGDWFLVPIWKGYYGFVPLSAIDAW